MFEIILKDSKLVRGIFEAIAAIVGESKILFTPNGVTLNSIDDGRICLISLTLEESDFDGYKCDEDYDLGLNIDDLVKILRRSSANDEITFNYKPETKKINIIMKSEKGKKSRRFSLGLIDLGDSGIKPEALDGIQYNAGISIPLNYLDEAIKDADIFSETLLITLSNEEGIIFKSEGQIGESETVLEKDDEGVQDFNVTEKGDGTFALQYLKNIVKISAIADRVELSLNPNTPLKAKFKILSGSSFKYFLAPRIEEEEEDYDENY